MTETTKKMKEESDLVYEMMGGKKKPKKVEVTEGSDGLSTIPEDRDKDADQKETDEVTEILYGEKKKPKTGDAVEKNGKKGKTAMQEEHDSVNDILYGKKKPKTDSAVPVESAEKLKGKKFDRSEYFGL